MEQGEPILLLCEGFPPVAGIGGRRWAKFAKELARRGHPVHVIRAPWRKGDAVSLWDRDGQEPGIFHHPLPNRYPRVLSRRPITKLRDRITYNFWIRALPLATSGNIYDGMILSRRAVLRSAKRLINDHNIRKVIATGAPFSLLAYGAELKQADPRIHYVADFRDEWTWKGHYGLGAMKGNRANEEQRKEALVMAVADKLISPHGPILKHLREQYGGNPERFVQVAHVIDPDDFPSTPLRVPADHFRMIYAGALYGEKETTAFFMALAEAMRKAMEASPENVGRFCYDLYITGGRDLGPYRELMAREGLSEQVHFHAPLAPREMMGELGKADLMLNFHPRERKDVLATKFNETFYSGLPILLVGDPGLASRTIEQRGMGASLRVEELATELPRILARERVIEVDRNADHSAYLLPAVTDRLIKEVLR